jgi:hypothetical protein
MSDPGPQVSIPFLIYVLSQCELRGLTEGWGEPRFRPVLRDLVASSLHNTTIRALAASDEQS